MILKRWCFSSIRILSTYIQIFSYISKPTRIFRTFFVFINYVPRSYFEGFGKMFFWQICGKCTSVWMAVVTNCRQTVNPRYFGKYSAGQIYSGGGSSNACYPFITSALIGPQYWPQLHNVTLGNIPIANKKRQRRQQCKDSNNADNNNKDNNITLEQFHANLSSPICNPYNERTK